MKKYYLAYGSNLNLLQMQTRCVGSKPIGTAVLDNYQLSYKGSMDGYSYLTIEEKDESYVPVGVYKISHLDEALLDKYEGYPELYYKEYKTVNVNGRKRKALIYVMRPEFEYYIPSTNYVNICKKGYKDFGFSEEILDQALQVTIENRVKKLVRK